MGGPAKRVNPKFLGPSPRAAGDSEETLSGEANLVPDLLLHVSPVSCESRADRQRQTNHMKKTKPSTKPAAPQVKAAAPAAAKSAAVKKKTAAPLVKKGVVKKVAAPKKAPAPKKVAAKPAPAKTTIVARIDIGFGNSLQVRGEGPGLSWDAGVAMTPVEADYWSYTITGATAPVIFKLLVNDLTWSTGEDFVVAPGETLELVPSF